MKLLFLTIGHVHNLKFHGLYTDMLREFKDRGIDVYVVAAAEKRTGLQTKLFYQDGIHFLQVKTGNLTKCGSIEKGISTVRLQNQYKRAIDKYFHGQKFDLVLYVTPPITFLKVVRHIKKRCKAKSYLMLKDIFPQNAVDLGYFSKISIFYLYFRLKEKGFYKVSDYIGCMSPANKAYLLKHNPWLDADKIEICPNTIKPMKKIKAIRKSVLSKYDIPADKTVLVYGGNLGRPQGLEFLIKLIKKYKENTEVFFAIVGSGTEFKIIKKAIEENKLNNVRLIPTLEEREYAKLISVSDVGLLFLDPRFTIPNFPSRLLAYFEQELPVLAATDTVTDIRHVLEENQAGLWVKNGDTIAFMEAVKTLSENPELRRAMGINGRRVLEEQYTTDVCCDTILKHFPEYTDSKSKL